MTVSSTNTIRQFNGDGSTAAFAYNFKVFADADLQVIVRSATGVESVKSSGTHYNASGVGETSGGTVTFTSGNIPASGETITLRRAMTIEQSLDLVPNDPLPAANLEDQLDKLTHLILQNNEELGRAIKLSRTNTMTSTEFTNSATDRASKVLSFDASGELAVTQELGTFKGTSATTTTAAFTVRDIVKGSTTAQLNNIYICVADSVVGDTLTDTDHFALIVDAVSAASSATTASTQATAAASSATAAASSASTASTQASNASSSASTASTQATNAASSATAAAASAASAATALDNFDDVYLGSKSSDPSTDNDGDSLNAGDLYFNTSSSVLKVYDGSSWDAIESFTTGISNTNIPVFTSGVVDNDFLKVDGTSIEGRSASEVLSDIGASAVAGSSSIVTTGALNSGSITSGFGTIDTGSSTITTTGEVGVGRLNLSSTVSSGDLGSDAAQVGYASADGLLLMGQGTTNDVVLLNDTGTIVCRIPTGLSQFIVSGSFQVSSSVGGKAYLTTSEQTVVADDSLGALEWYAPSETSGTDSIGKSGAIECVAEGEFTATANPTKMEFKLGVSEAATAKMTLSSSGDLNVTGGITTGGSLNAVTDIIGTSSDMTIKNTANGENIFLKTTSSNSLITPVKIHSGGVFEAKLGAVFNEDSADVDFRVESNGNENMLFVDGGNDAVGIGTGSPDAPLEIEGTNSSTTQFSGYGGLRIHNTNGSAHGFTAEMYFTAGTGGSNRGTAIGAEYTSASSGNDLYFATNGGNVTSANTLTERMRITSGGSITTPDAGTKNTKFGSDAGVAIVSGGTYNSTFGCESGLRITSGDRNSCFGYKAGANISTGNDNVCLGYDTGCDINQNLGITTTSDHICIGRGAGMQSNATSANIFIGTYAGIFASGGNNCVLIIMYFTSLQHYIIFNLNYMHFRTPLIF